MGIQRGPLPERCDFDIAETPMPNPTDEQLASPEFEAIWQAIKSWDVNVPEHHSGYCGANGSHVALILNALEAVGGDE
jgi:hypothetical protein